ncbi:MAG: hypothetical protein ACI857_001941 [Arenicella sp.]|jgi:hypothetical protein
MLLRNSIPFQPTLTITLLCKTKHMKSLVKLMLFAFVLALTSCGIGNNGFQKQKFTNLKSLKSSYIMQDVKGSSMYEIEPSSQDEALLELDDDDPKTTAIKAAISNDQTIVLHKNDKQYRVNDPVYDGFYKSLFGELEEIPSDIKFDSALEFEVSQNDDLTEGNGFPLSKMTLKKVSSSLQEKEFLAEDVHYDTYDRPASNPRVEKAYYPEDKKVEKSQSNEPNRARVFLKLSFLSILLSLAGLLRLMIF